MGAPWQRRLEGIPIHRLADFRADAREVAGAGRFRRSGRSRRCGSRSRAADRCAADRAEHRRPASHARYRRPGSLRGGERMNVRHTPPIRKTKSRGFTLIEVLVALAIVAITLGAGIKAAGSLSYNAERLTDASLGQWCADNQLIGLKLAHPGLSIGDSDFVCEQM